MAKDTQTRDRVIAHLKEKNIPNMIYYPTPQHALPVFKAEPHYGETYANANDYCARTLSLPMHPYMDAAQQQTIIDAVRGGTVMEEKYFVHPSSFVDEDVEIGEGTKIWHFCHTFRRGPYRQALLPGAKRECQQPCKGG